MPDRVSARQLALAVLVLVATGVAAGFVWEWLWSAPVGAVVDGAWVAQDEQNLRASFSGTGWYVVIAAVAGLVGGAVVALFLDRSPLVTLAGLTVGSALGGLVMYAVGVWLGPPDPVETARSAAEGATLPAALGVSGGTPFLAMPAGALVALTVVFLGLAARDRAVSSD